jgi:gliding motility-associated-like protein
MCELQNTDLVVTLTGAAPWTVNYTLNGVPQTEVINASPYTVNLSPAAGVYSYVVTSVTDDNGCSAVAPFPTYVLTVNPLPTATLTGTTAICSGSNTDLTFTLTGTAPWTVAYELNGVAQTPLNVAASPFTLNVMPAVGDNVYTITSVTDANTCTMLAPFPSATVTVYPLPTSTLTGTTAICDGDNTDLTFELTGAAPWTVAYTLNGVAQTPLNIAASPFTLNVTPALGTNVYAITSVTDANTCAMLAPFPSAAVTVRPLPTVTVSANATICEGQSSNLVFTLTGTAPWTLSYTVNGSPQTDVVNASPYTLTLSPAAGSYNYVVTGLTDANGCVMPAPFPSYTLLVNPLPTSTLTGTTAICSGDNTDLTFELTGTAPWTVAYTLNGVAQTPLNIAASPFTLNVSPAVGTNVYAITSVTDANTCSMLAPFPSATVTVRPLPTVTVSANATICEGQSSNLVFTLTGTAPWTLNYTLNGVPQTDIVNASPYTLTLSPTAGTYNYVVTGLTDANGCVMPAPFPSYTLVVNPLPTATLTGTTAICSGSNTNLTFSLTGTAPWTVAYTLNGVAQTPLNIAASPFTLNVSPAVGTNVYAITSVTDANTCSMLAPFPSATVTVHPLPTVTVSPNATICEGQSSNLVFTFTGAAPWNLNYNLNGVPQSVTVNTSPYTLTLSPTAGTYNYVVTGVTDANGCNAAVLPSYSLLVNPLPTATLAGNATICSGDNTNLVFTFTGTAPWQFTYTINGIPQTPVVAAASPHTITVSPPVGATVYQVSQVTDANTCVSAAASNTVTVNVNPLPTGTLSTSDATLCQGESSDLIFNLTGTAPWTINYTLNGVAQPTLTANVTPFTHTVTPAVGTNTYAVTNITDANTCTANVLPDPISIVVHPTPVITLTPPSTQICLGSSADLTLSLTGTSPWTVQWTADGVAQAPMLVNISPFVLTVSPSLGVHTYQITSIEDANGCVSASPSATVSVTVVPLPTVAMTGGAEICLGESASFNLTMTGAAPWTVNYTLNGTPQTLTVPTTPFVWTLTPALGNNVYQITGVTDANGCQALLPAGGFPNGTILVRPRPTLAVSGTTAICQFGNTDLVFTMTGIPPYTIQYTLNGVAQTPITTSDNPYVHTVTHNTAGSYLYALTQISDMYCTQNVGLTTTATVTVHPLPTGTISGGGEICEGQSSVVNFSMTGTPPYNIQYQLNGVSQTPLTATTNTFNLTVTPPVGTNVYTITQITDGNGCVQTNFTSSATVNVRPLPTNTLPVVADPTSHCRSGESDVFVGSLAAPTQPGVRYRLFRTDTNTLLDQDFGNGGVLTLQTGTLTTAITTGFVDIPMKITATDLNYPTACERDLLQTFTIRLYPRPTATLTGTNTICEGTNTPISFALTGNGPWTLTYTRTIDGVTETITQNVLTSPFVTNEEAGTFALVSLSDANCTALPSGLTGTATITVVPLPVVTMTSDDFDNAICENQSITFTAAGADLYTFYLNGVPVGGTGNTYTFPAGSLTISADGTLNEVWVVGQISTANCQGQSAKIRVKVHPLPTVDLGFSPRFICSSSDTVTFNASLGGAAGDYTYNWRKISGTTSVTAPGPVGQPIYHATSPGKYFVIITDNRFPTLCQTTSDTIEVLNFDAPVLDLGPDTTVCSATLPHTLVAQDLSHGLNVAYAWYKVNNATGLPVLYPTATAGTFQADSAGYYIAQVTDLITGCSRRDTVRLQINQNPIYSITGHAGPTCLPSDTLIIVRTDVAPATIQWFGPGITGTSADGLQAYVNQSGVYTAVVTLDDTGCSTTKSINVEVGAAITAKVKNVKDGGIVVCEDQKVRLEAFHPSHNVNYTYEWRQLTNNVVVGDQSFLDLTFATTQPEPTYQRLRYSVTVRGPGGCRASDTVFVEFKRKSVAELEGTYPEKICLGEKITFQGKGGLTYEWCINGVCQSGVSSFEFKPEKAGIYVIGVRTNTTNDCSPTVAEHVVRVYDLPEVALPNDTKVLCETQTAEFNAFKISHDADFVYEWKNLATGEVIGNEARVQIAFGGTYNTVSFAAYVTDPESGCINGDTVKVRFVRDVAPEILPHTAEICLGESVEIKARGGENFLWSTGDSTDKITVKPATVGWHRYIVSVNNGNECSAKSDTTYVLVNPLPVVKAHTSDTINICAGRSIRLLPSGARNYLWSHDPNAKDSITVSPTVTTLYIVTGFDVKGCTGTDSVLVIVSPTADLGADRQLCAGETTVIGIDSLKGATYLWLPTGETSPKITVRRSGRYELRVKIDSCEFNDFITVTFKENPKPKVVKDTIVCFDSDDIHEITADLYNRDKDVTYLYQWFDTLGNLVGYSDKFKLDSAGIYRLKITAMYPHPCTGETMLTVEDMCASQIFVPEAFSPNGDGLNDEFKVFGKHVYNFKMTIYNRWNEVVFHTESKTMDEAKFWDGTYKGEPSPDGVYQYEISYTSEERVNETKKITGGIVLLR